MSTKHIIAHATRRPLIDTVYLSRLVSAGNKTIRPSRVKRRYMARIDPREIQTVISHRVARQVGAKIMRRLGPPLTALVAVAMDGYHEGHQRVVVARVSDSLVRLVRQFTPKADLIVGRDFLQEPRGPSGARFSPSGAAPSAPSADSVEVLPLSRSEVKKLREWLLRREQAAERRRIARQQWKPGWHHHAFSPLCKDEVHGRIDAALGETGFEVQDVGTGVVVAYAGSGYEAIEIAEALAAEWRPVRTRITNPYFLRLLSKVAAAIQKESKARTDEERAVEQEVLRMHATGTTPHVNPELEQRAVEYVQRQGGFDVAPTADKGRLKTKSKPC